MGNTTPSEWIRSRHQRPCYAFLSGFPFCIHRWASFREPNPLTSNAKSRFRSRRVWSISTTYPRASRNRIRLVLVFVTATRRYSRQLYLCSTGHTEKCTAHGWTCWSDRWCATFFLEDYRFFDFGIMFLSTSLYSLRVSKCRIYAICLPVDELPLDEGNQCPKHD